MTTLNDFLQHVNFQDAKFQQTILMVFAAPIVWNTLARTQYYTNWMVKLFCGNAYFACYALAAYIFSFSAWRDLVFHEMMVEQGKWVFLDNDIAFYAGAALFAWGGTLVLSSMWALGVTGTYLGDYMGILMDDRVTGFPFNVTEHPMYRGSALSFLGHALMGASAPGLLVALAVHVAYLLAELFEGPFTAGIYAKRDADRAAAKGKGNKTRKAD